MTASQRDNGSMLLEFVISMPILMVLAMLILQFAQIWTAKQLVAYSAFCAARSTLCVNGSEAQSASEFAARRVMAWSNILGVGGLGDLVGMRVPGWGVIPETAGIDRDQRVTVRLDSKIQDLSAGLPANVRAAQVTFRCPLLVPVAGQMISWYAYGGHYSEDDWETFGWTGKKRPSAFPYIELTETCILPLPYSTASLPSNAYRNDSYF